MVTPLAQRGNGIILSDGGVLRTERDLKVIFECRQLPSANCSWLMGVAKVMNCTRENGLTLENFLNHRKVDLKFQLYLCIIKIKDLNDVKIDVLGKPGHVQSPP